MVDGASAAAWASASPSARMLLAVLVLLGSPPARAQAPAATLSWEGGDASVDPGTDFFRFANGGWLDAHPIPPDRGGFSLATELRNSAAAAVRGRLEEAAATVQGAPADTIYRSDARQQLRAYYMACLDEARADALGMAPLAPARVSRSGGIRTLFRDSSPGAAGLGPLLPGGPFGGPAVGGRP